MLFDSAIILSREVQNQIARANTTLKDEFQKYLLLFLIVIVLIPG